MIEFDLPKEQSSIIKVIGVGGGGCNAVNHMFQEGITGVNFVICNTDKQALEMSPVPNKIQLGPEITEGLGAGSNPEVGEQAAIESMEEVRLLLEKNTKMVFITAGMGGGTGTGAAPVIAKIARELGILTVGIVTTPFSFEGRRKVNQANDGIERMKEAVDSILVISNDRLRQIFGNLTRSAAFAKADDILTTAAKSISEIITHPGEVNVDFADVEYVIRDSGVAIMGSAIATGDERAISAVEEALTSPLLNENDIRGAQHILLNITTGTQEMLVDEINEITEYVQRVTETDTDLILGLCDDPSLGEQISVTIIATGFEGGARPSVNDGHEKRVVGTLSPPSSKDLEDKNNSDDDDQNSQTTFEFEVKKRQTPSSFTPTPPPSPPTQRQESPSADQDQFNRQVSQHASNDLQNGGPQDVPQRVQRLKEISISLNNPSIMKDMESKPAYLRRNIELEDAPNSADRGVSNYTLSDPNEEGRPEIRKNNSYLHDNVD